MLNPLPIVITCDFYYTQAEWTDFQNEHTYNTGRSKNSFSYLYKVLELQKTEWWGGTSSNEGSSESLWKLHSIKNCMDFIFCIKINLSLNSISHEISSFVPYTYNTHKCSGSQLEFGLLWVAVDYMTSKTFVSFQTLILLHVYG